MKEGCVFCQMLEAGEPTFGEGEHFVCRLDVHPVSPGHMLIIPKRHIPSLNMLTAPEWKELKKIIEIKSDSSAWPLRERLEQLYQKLLEKRYTENSVWFIDQALSHPRLGEVPDGFNHAVNEGTAAGQTEEHLHWHVIPRYAGDMDDPTGGGRHVIPKMGNYKIPRGE